MISATLSENIEYIEHVHTQIKENILIAQAMGIKQIIVAVNNMMNVGDFNNCNIEADNEHKVLQHLSEVKNDMTAMLKKVGFNPNNVTFVPISARHDCNVYETYQIAN